MTTAIETIIRRWGTQRMNMHELRCTTFENNKASVRVFEKNGFVFMGTVKDALTLGDAKGGGKMGLNVLELNL